MLQPIFTVTSQDETDSFARVIFEPLEKGYGNTLGVSLRRVLLTSIQGSAVSQITIDGVQHQFSSLTGMKQDVVDLVLNVKGLNFSIIDDAEEVRVKLIAQGPSEITGRNIEMPPNVTLANPDHFLASLADKKSKLAAEMIITKGFGYVPASETIDDQPIGTIPVDATYSPIIRVAYKVETTRVGRRTDYDRLIMDIHTKGSINAADAIKMAAEILVAHYNQIISPVIVEVKPERTLEDRMEDEVLRLTVEELDLPTRIANALRKGGYKTVKDLTKANREDIAKVKNLGEKSVKTVSDALVKKSSNLSLAD